MHVDHVMSIEDEEGGEQDNAIVVSIIDEEVCRTGATRSHPSSSRYRHTRTTVVYIVAQTHLFPCAKFPVFGVMLDVFFVSLGSKGNAQKSL